MTRTINMGRVEVKDPFSTWFSDSKSIRIGQWDIQIHAFQSICQLFILLAVTCIRDLDVI